MDGYEDDHTHAGISGRKEVKIGLAGFIAAAFSSLFALAAGCGYMFDAVSDTLDKSNPLKGYVAGLLVVTTDYQTGGLCVIDENALTATVWPDVVYSDSTAAADDKYVYVIQRYGSDSIQVRSRFEGLKLVAEYGLEAGSNPHGFASLQNGSAVAVNYSKPYLTILDAQTGKAAAKIDGTIFSRGEPDALPEFDALVQAESFLYVPIQRLDRRNGFAPYANGEIAVFNALSLDWEKTKDESGNAIPLTVKLRRANPFLTRYYPQFDLIAAACAGRFLYADGAIESFKPFKNEYVGEILTEEAAGGDVISFELTSDSGGFAIISDENSNTLLARFKSGAVIQTILKTDGYKLVDAALSTDGKRLFAADRSYDAPKVRVFDVETSEEIGDGIDCGLPAFFFLRLP